MSDPELLKSALLRISTASEWAYQAKLFNIGQELKVASKEIAKYLHTLAFKKSTNPEDDPQDGK